MDAMNARQQYQSKQLFKNEILELASIQSLGLHMSIGFK